MHSGWKIGVVGPAVDVEAVDAVLVGALGHVRRGYDDPGVDVLTCGGPRIVPFQFDMRRSSPSANPYEQASDDNHLVSARIGVASTDVLPAPRPFSPFSNSSSRRKFRGTLAPIVCE